MDGIYNDLGFMVGDRVVILIEAQSTWTVNIAVRALLYLAQTYQDYIRDTEQMKLHGRTRETVTETIRICKDKGIQKSILRAGRRRLRTL